MGESILTLREYGVAFGERVVLASVDARIPVRGVTVLLGPAGTGKSTLLRTLAGFNTEVPSARTWGSAVYAGEVLDDAERPALVAQNARLMTASVLENIVYALPERQILTQAQQKALAQRLLQRAGLPALADRLGESVVNLPLATQRHLAIVRTAACSPKLLFVDEPTSGLEDAAAERLLDYIREESERRAMLVVVHNQRHAKRLGGQTLLLAGGCIQETAMTPEFFANPTSQAARDFVRSGSCSVPSPQARPEELDQACAAPQALPKGAHHGLSDAFGPRGFLWLRKGVLAGTPRPGVVHDIEYDLKALQRVGITVLVSLTQTPVDGNTLSAYGIRSIASPIEDMGAPDMAQAAALCGQIETLCGAGEVVAVHCRAGLGRTGTVLAAQLIWEGCAALDALETVRRIEPRWVQSEEQVAFLEAFAHEMGKGVKGKHVSVVND